MPNTTLKMQIITWLLNAKPKVMYNDNIQIQYVV